MEEGPWVSLVGMPWARKKKGIVRYSQPLFPYIPLSSQFSPPMLPSLLQCKVSRGQSYISLGSFPQLLTQLNQTPEDRGARVYVSEVQRAQLLKFQE